MTDLFNTSPTLIKILTNLPPESRTEAFRLLLEDESLLEDLLDSWEEIPAGNISLQADLFSPYLDKPKA